MLETFRKGLIRWNVAPLSLVGVMVYAMFDLINFYKSSSCEADALTAGGVLTCVAAIAGLIYKMYDSMQKDRGHVD